MKLMKEVSRLGCLAAVALLSGCAAYAPQSFWEVSKTRVDLEANNFKVRKLGAQGSAETPFLLGFPMGGSIMGIPLGSMDIQKRAMEDLHKNWDGKGSCVLHNINTEWADYGVPCIFVWHQNTITADIYEFDGEYKDYAPRKSEAQQ